MSKKEVRRCKLRVTWELNLEATAKYGRDLWEFKYQVGACPSEAPQTHLNARLHLPGYGAG